MKTYFLLRTTLSLLLISLITVTIASGQSTRRAVQASQAPSQVQYRVIDLGADNALGNDIPDSGRVVGSKNFGDQRHASFWPNIHSDPIDLGTLPGGRSS